MIPTALTDNEKRELALLARGETVLELGALLGASTVVLASTANWVYSVDPHDGYPENNPRSTLKAFQRNLEVMGAEDNVTVILDYDFNVTPFLREYSMGLVFIDLTGKYDDTYQAMERAVTLIRPGGTLAVHDCGHPDWPGVQVAVNDFAAKHVRTYRKVDKLAIFDFGRGAPLLFAPPGALRDDRH